MHELGQVVVQEGECNPILGPDRLTNDDLVDVVELVPVVVLGQGVLDEGLELGSARDGDVERLGGEEGLHVEQVEVVLVHQVGQQLIGHPTQATPHIIQDFHSSHGIKFTDIYAG